MAICPKIDRCPFFNGSISGGKEAVMIHRSNYCGDDPSRCARLAVADRFGFDLVPSDMYPDQTDRAMDILNK